MVSVERRECTWCHVNLSDYVGRITLYFYTQHKAVFCSPDCAERWRDELKLDNPGPIAKIELEKP